MKKRLAKVCVTLVTALSVLPSFAAGDLLYQNEAKILYDLNLYKGVNETKYEPDLESSLTREQSAVLLIRLFGNQNHADKISNSEATAILAKFKDAKKISGWAKREVAYGVSCGYIKGIEKEDGLYFEPQGSLKGIDYASLILQQLKVTNFEYQKALQKLKEEGIITTKQQDSFNKQQLIRDDVVGISYGVLKAKIDEDTTIIESLVNKGIVKKDKAVKFGLIKEEIEEPVVKPTEEPVVKPTEEPVVKPTEEPVVKPTEEPVVKPTEEPVVKPTEEPVVKPTEEPVVKPTEEPVVKPTEEPVVKPTEEPVIKPTEEPIQETNLKRAEGAIKLGQWTLSNSSREPIKIDKIYLSAEYGGQVSALKPAYVTDYSIEDEEGNVYGTASSVQTSKGINLSKPFTIDAMVDGNETEEDIYVYAKVNSRAVYGGTIELFLGDNTNLFEATGAITGVRFIKTGERVAQEDGEITISISKILPVNVSYNKTPVSGEAITVGAFELENKGSKAVLMETITLREITNTTDNVSYSLFNEKMETIAKADSRDGIITFEIENGQKISANKSERFTVKMDDVIPASHTVQLRLLKDGTSYDSLDNKGYAINIDDDLTLGEVEVKR